ncbi:MAG: sortase, partial [Candidatus Promineifilaceae bacterium]|nr:sortase [Candidatus Promineifilaceae bacterium]
SSPRNNQLAAAIGPALRAYTPPSAGDMNVPLLLPANKNPDPSARTWDDIAEEALETESDWRILTYPEGNGQKPSSSLGSEQQMRLAIPALEIEAPVLPVSLSAPQASGSRVHRQWTVPEKYAAGWHDNSARPGRAGNIVLNGHNNIHGAIFKNLVDLPLGAEIILFDDGVQHIYQVTGRQFLLEQGEPLRNRLKNARWILPTEDERLTLVTCWPNSSNSHRLVVVAHPFENG